MRQKRMNEIVTKKIVGTFAVVAVLGTGLIVNLQAKKEGVSVAEYLMTPSDAPILASQSTYNNIDRLSEQELKICSYLVNESVSTYLKNAGFHKDSQIIFVNEKPYLVSYDTFTVLTSGGDVTQVGFHTRDLYELSTDPVTLVKLENLQNYTETLNLFITDSPLASRKKTVSHLSELIDFLNIDDSQLLKIKYETDQHETFINFTAAAIKTTLDNVFKEKTKLPEKTAYFPASTKDKESFVSEQILNHIISFQTKNENSQNDMDK